ncbi:zinc-binding alcohol dehydrogenase family protein [Pedobacter sp. L105]|uniref:zinc-binding alcohol dehydrogenase family protein n=1 Tax=Pedobacter sp. L105 TaxID=1641871 RepID=UPI00131A73D2|nr:zinc-binding alcohol dehydrogenase family protein [Pedobacter sp. L105]
MSAETPQLNHSDNKNNDTVPKNEAAWLLAQHGLLEVKEAPFTKPGAGEILVRNHAVAVNPIDWMIPYLGKRLFPWIKYPFVLGFDLAGKVVAIGKGVTNVKVGDRVLALAGGSVKQRNRAAEGAFQTYPIVLSHLTTVLPDHLSYVDAAVIPLGLSTAACGLFQKDALALNLPTIDTKPLNQWVVISGGATSVGCNAIQLAVAAGYSVVTTASPKNFNYVRSLGAAIVFDYNSKEIVNDMIVALEGKYIAGALSIGAGSTETCIDVLAQCEGRKFVANVSSAVSFDTIPEGRGITFPVILKLIPNILASSIKIWLKSRLKGVTAKFYDSSSMVDNEIGKYIFHDYLGKALSTGTFQAAPKPKIVGTSLHDIQGAFEIQRRGVSAAKVVVDLT